jgi:TonB family protein
MVRALLLFVLLFPLQSPGPDMPPEVQKLQNAIESIPGITDATIGKVDLSEVLESDFGLLPYGDLPLGALRRTKGGLAGEVVVSVNFGITRDPKGLKALEFISWWVRDAARGSEPIQIRSLALPPIGDQFGTTLRFTIDYFHVDPKEDIGKLLSTVGKLADGLNSSKSLYHRAVAPLGATNDSPVATSESAGSFIPKAIHTPAAPYPPSLLRRCIGGKVIFSITVAESGHVTDVTIISSPDKAFNDPVAKVVKSSWRFEPYTAAHSGAPARFRSGMGFNPECEDEA